MSEQEVISGEFPYQSRFVEVLGSKIHYIDEGEGKPILFLHGMPATNYSWRNVIPYISKQGRCMAPDLIGMGRSDNPDISYRVVDHIRYIEAFIEALNLKDITLVLHGWGSVIGFDYAMRYEENIRALVFFESHIRPLENWNQHALPVQEVKSFLQSLAQGIDSLAHSQELIYQLVYMGSMRKLSDDEMKNYFFANDHDSKFKPVIQYFKDYFHHDDSSEDVMSLIAAYSKKLEHSLIPKLMLYAVPGFNTTIDTVVWAQKHLANLTLVDLGEDLHLMQETQPETLGQKIAGWVSQL